MKIGHRVILFTITNFTSHIVPAFYSRIIIVTVTNIQDLSMNNITIDDNYRCLAIHHNLFSLACKNDNIG